MVILNPDLENDKEVTYYRDREEFEKIHIKMVGTAFYISILRDGSIVGQTGDKLVASCKNLKTVANFDGTIMKISFIKLWIYDENTDAMKKLCLFHILLLIIHSFIIILGVDLKMNYCHNVPLPPSFDIGTNEYVLMYKEFIIICLMGNSPLLISMMLDVPILFNILHIEVLYV